MKRNNLQSSSLEGNEADFLASPRNRPPRHLGGYAAARFISED